nr:hypothetical protein [uncultured Flavobacterium sp.]
MSKFSLIFVVVCCLSFNVKVSSQSSTIGKNEATKLTVYEYYNHAPSEWIKVFRIKNAAWQFGGIAGSLYFVDYRGEGASKIDFVFPQIINDSQKPLLTLIGNSSRDISWYALRSPNDEYYDVYIKTPDYHVGLTFMFRSFAADVFISPETPITQNWSWTSTLNQESVQSVLANGNVGIGTSNPTSKLTVAGNINSREVKVSVDAGADFVFEKDYALPSLQEVEKFVTENKHLPEIASAKDMQKEGINLSEMNIKLLQKIEELTLYLIEQQKDIEMLKKELKNKK